MKNVKIDFLSSFEQNELSEQISYKTIGELQEDKHYKTLCFDEVSAEDDSIIKVIVKYNDDEVIVCRDGQIYQELNFFRNKNSFGTYEISGFNIKLNIVLIEFKVEANQIHLKYELIVQQQPSGIFNIDIKVGEINE